MYSPAMAKLPPHLVEPMARFVGGATLIREAVTGIDLGALSHANADGWSIRDILVHLSDAEMVRATRIRLILASADPPAIFDFDEAKALGIVTDVIEAADGAAFMAEVRRRALEYVPPARASKAIGLIKRAVHSGAEMALGEGLALERELQQQLFESEDAREGLAANVEKRTPVFKGR